MNLEQKVSFDFDDTLDKLNVQTFVKELLKLNIEVWVVTSRYSDKEFFKRFNTNKRLGKIINLDIYKIIKELGIPRNRLIFTEFEDKWNFFKNNNDFIFHLDDCFIEINRINKNTKVTGISCTKSNWKNKCLRKLNIQY